MAPSKDAALDGMHTILGAGCAIGVELASELTNKGHRIRLVGRSPKPASGADQVVSADLADLDQAIKAEILHLPAGQIPPGATTGLLGIAALYKAEPR